MDKHAFSLTTHPDDICDRICDDIAADIFVNIFIEIQDNWEIHNLRIFCQSEKGHF